MVIDKIISKKSVVVTGPDFDRLQALVDSPRYRLTHAPLLLGLRSAIEQASVVSAGEIPPDVVTMRSTLQVRDERQIDSDRYTLVYPEEADFETGKLSVLAPMGLAMLGAWVGQVVRFDAPAGKRRLTIEKILYQPESSGDFHL